MCPKVKRYKGKEMGTFSRAQKSQKVCLEGVTGSEGKVKKVLRNIGAAELKSEGLHLGLLVNIVLAGIAETVLKTASFGGQCPDQAFAGGECFGCAAENFVLKGEGSVDPLPAGGFKRGHYVRKDESI